jgi:nucleoside-diphosphate-sugar epimerase
MIDLTDKIIVLTGGEGFFGSFIYRALMSRKAKVVVVPHSKLDLMILQDVVDFFVEAEPDYCIHCAGYNGGIQFNIANSAHILYTNTVMGLNIYEACRVAEVKKLVSIMSSCAYPDTGMEILNEKDFWNGPPNSTIKSHGIAKRILQCAAEAYKKQHDLNAVTVCVTNLYGEFDTFNLDRTKVVGALIRKVVESKIEDKPFVQCLGTGKPKREFMYVRDGAEGVVQALEKYEDSFETLNIGTGTEITIKDLIEKIVKCVGYEGKISWDTSRPDGQMKKLLDTTKMQDILDLDITEIDDGLERTISWYMNHKVIADGRK